MVTSLRDAAWHGDIESAKSLINNGADVNAKDEEGLSPMSWAILKGHADMARFLLEKGADVNAKDNEGRNALAIATNRGNIDVVRMLLEKSAAVNAKDGEGENAFIIAIKNDRADIWRLLLDNGADANAKDSEGESALMLFAKNGDNEVVRQLLDKGADANAKDKAGRTALHIAVKKSNATITRMLLGHGADPELMDNDGKNAVMLAQAKNDPIILKLIEEAELGIARRDKSAASGNAAGISPAVKSDVDELPVTKVKKQKNSFALVIGIEQYRQKLPKADFAVQDAKTVSEYLTKALGFPEENVITLLNDNAAKSDFEKYFEKWLGNNVEKNGTVFIYFSGHGAPDSKSSSAYLVPYDGDPAFLDQTGYSLKRMYEALGKLPAKEIIVALDSCFSGAGGRSVLAKGARPIVLSVDNPILLSKHITVLSASGGNQISSTFDEKGHGLFTYFLLKGIKNEDVIGPDGSIMVGDLFSYVKPQVERIARKQYNNEQTPQLIGAKQ